jgi:hypothetical protein
MGVVFNPHGFVLMDQDNTLIQDSRKSAHSGKWVRPTGVLVAVPDTPGLFYRITHGESARLTKTQHKVLHKKAQEWLASITEADSSKSRRGKKASVPDETDETLPDGDDNAPPAPDGDDSGDPAVKS